MWQEDQSSCLSLRKRRAKSSVEVGRLGCVRDKLKTAPFSSAHTHTPLGQAEPPGEAVHECQTPCMCLILCRPCRAWREALWRACSRSSSTLRSAGASQEVSLAQALEAGRTRWGQPLGCLEELPLACHLTPHRLSSSLGPFWASLPRISNNGLGFQVPACVRIRVWWPPPACLFPGCVYL